MKKQQKTTLAESLELCKESMNFFFDLAQKEFDIATQAVDDKDKYAYKKHFKEHAHLSKRFIREKNRFDLMLEKM